MVSEHFSVTPVFGVQHPPHSNRSVRHTTIVPLSTAADDHSKPHEALGAAYRRLALSGSSRRVWLICTGRKLSVSRFRTKNMSSVFSTRPPPRYRTSSTCR
jgi:hypothetical protein